MPSRYYYGGSVKSNRVKASAARTFSELVKKHLDTAVPLNLTREEYQAIPSDTKEGKEARLTAKDTTYLVACVYTVPEGEEDVSRERSFAKAANCCNLLFLDLDVDKNGECPAARFLHSPEILSRALKPFNFIAYTTASSTPEKPRMRIVVDAENIPLDDYPRAVRTIAARIGLENVTKESLIPNQPMICPSRFSDQNPDTEHPRVVSNVKGRSFLFSDLGDEDADLPESERKEKRPQGEEDGLEYLRAPLMGVDLKQIKEALNHVTPNTPYFEWFDICCALRHQFGGTEDEGAAFDLFDEWSSTGSTYPGESEVRKQWDNVSPTPRGRVPVTIRTLIKRAHDGGWNSGALKADCFSAVNDWINDEAKTFHDLTQVALQKIAGLPVLTFTEEGLLLKSICIQLDNRLGEKGKAADLKKDLDKLRSARDRLKKEKKEEKDPPWTMGWFYVATREEFFRPASHTWRTKEALNSEYSRYLLASLDQLESVGKEATEAALFTPPLLPAQVLLNKYEIPVVDDTDYDPCRPKESYSEDANGLKLVNTYRASYPKPNMKDQEKAANLFLRHLENLIEEAEYRRFILDYIAFMVQNPGVKIRFSILIQGAEGCGKTFMARVLGTVLGEENVMYVNNEAIRGNWNEWSVGSQAIVIGEVRISGHNRHDVMNKLKDLITDDFVPVNRKHADTRKCKNVTNYIMFTNFPDALAVMSGSRRYFVVKSPLQTEESVLALGPDYFKELFELLDKYAGGLRSFFENWEISESFDPNGRAPKTKYLEEMIEDSADETTATLRRLIKEKDSPLIADDMIWQPVLDAALNTQGVSETPQRLGKLLKDEHYVKVPGSRPTIDETKGYLWIKQGAFTKKTKEEITRIARQRAASGAGQREDNNEPEDFC